MRHSPSLRFGVRAAFAAIGVFLLAVPFGLLVLLVRTQWSPLLRFDLYASTSLHRAALDHSSLVIAMRVLSAIGTTPVWLGITALTVGWLLRRRLHWLALFTVVTIVGGSILNHLVKRAVDRARPVLPEPVAHASGLSFPSGHAQEAFIGYAVLLVVFLPALRPTGRRIAVVVAVVMVLAIGFSRIALGVHFVSDVLGGYILGAAWVAAMLAAFNPGRGERGQPRASPVHGREPGQEPGEEPGQAQWIARDRDPGDP
jgi:membrane-associated phospholipid phosphatase